VLAFGAEARPSLAAFFTKSAKRPLHFLHHLARVLHRNLADSELTTDLLFNRPETTSAMTSPSRRVSNA